MQSRNRRLNILPTMDVAFRRFMQRVATTVAAAKTISGKNIAT